LADFRINWCVSMPAGSSRHFMVPEAWRALPGRSYTRAGHAMRSEVRRPLLSGSWTPG